MKNIVLLIFSLNIHFMIFSQSGKDPVKVTDMLRIQSASSVNISKDGTMVCYTVTSIEPDTENKWEYKYVTQIWVVNTDGLSAPRQMTWKENSSQPVFSPDGKKIAFVRVEDGKPQLFILPLSGGEAYQLTHFKYGASAPKWSADGKQLLFSSGISMQDVFKDSSLNPSRKGPQWDEEKPGIAHSFTQNSFRPDPDGNMEEVRTYLANNAADKKAKVVNKLNLQDETGVNPELSFSHIFLVDAVPGAKPTPVTKGFYRFNNAEFMPDGRQVVMSGTIDSIHHPDRSQESCIYLVNMDGSQLRKLAGEADYTLSQPSVSPSGKWLAFQKLKVLSVGVPDLIVMEVNNPSNRTVISFDRVKSNMTWSADEKHLYFISPSNGGNPLYRTDVKTLKTEQLTSGETGITSFDFAGNKLVYSKTGVNNPSQLYAADAAGKGEKKLTSLNEEWLAKKAISVPEKHSFVNEKGLTIEYWVMKPINYMVGKKYPLLLNIHGGPSAMWGPGEPSMWHEFQYFSSKGYGVVYCNPRGSGGYGNEFLRANISDWGNGPTNDVLTSLDKTIAEGWADTSRLVLTGGSYAGYLVAWIIAHDQRFKAACSQRGVYDLATFFGEGNAWRLVPGYFGGYPWEDSVSLLLKRESPITYVDQIKTPYIIFHGENDRRTGVIQSEMLYRSLKVLNRPVEYVRHPGGTHELTRTGNNRQRIDQLLRTWEFFERWIGNK